MNNKLPGSIKLRLLISTLLLLIPGLFNSLQAQITVTGGYTASQMAEKLAGEGVTVFGATLTCPTPAYGEFVVNESTLGIDSGIVLTNGRAITDELSGLIGVNGPASDFATTDNSAPGDAALTALAGLPTFDACVLEFDFKPAGDTVRFKYVFGSEEYTDFTCTSFNDVFGFLISGGSFGTPVNIAKVPGTSIPVCINSVNCGPTGGGMLSTCTALGPGSPFCTYYVDNSAGTTATYDGLTTVLTAEVLVSPCDTYHLKLGVADASDHVLDSGVFIAAGSLTSRPPVAVSGVGLSGLPYCVRGCADGTFVFSTAVAQDTPIVVHYNVVGTGVNGYDYTTLPGLDTIVAGTLMSVITLHPLLVPPTGPKTVTLQIMIPDPCVAGAFTIGAESTLTILDSFTYHIVTPDTTICTGQFVHAIAIGDTVFSSILHYTWTPQPGISNDTILSPILTPTATTTYTLTSSTISAVGCPDEHETFTITINDPVLLAVDFVQPTVCGYYDGSMTLSGLVTGFGDTVLYSKNGVVQPGVPVVVSPSGTVFVGGLGAGSYTNIHVKVGACYTNALNIVIPNPPKPTVTVDSSLVLTCVGVPVQLHAYVDVSPAGTPISYSWTPPVGLSATDIANPIVTPIATADVYYNVVISPDSVTACWDTAVVHVHSLAYPVLNTPDDTICLGQSIHASITGSDEFSYSWSPASGVVSTTSRNPVITPVIPCITTYTVTGNYAHCPVYIDSFFTEVDTQAHSRVVTDTICLGMSDTFNVAVVGEDAFCNYYTYTWIPSVGVSDTTSGNPILTPSVATSYSVTIRPHAGVCAITDVFNIDVLPNMITILPADTAICAGAVVQAIGAGDPSFSYQWRPTAGIAVSNVLNALIRPDTTTDYVVTASFHRCPDMTAAMHIEVEPVPSVYIGGYRFLCQYDTLHINAVVNDPYYPHYTYSWSPATDLDNTTSATVVYSGLTGEMVYVTVSGPATNCIAMDSALITINPRPGSAITDMSFCPHDSAVLMPTPVTASFHWSPPYYLSDTNSNSPIIRPITTQTYTIVGTTGAGCKDTITFTATVYPAAVMLMPDSVVLYPGDSYEISPTTNCTSFTWFPPTGLSSAIISNPLATPDISTKYVVTATTGYGCATTDSIDLIVDPSAILAMPNAFTPGTGANSEFKIINRGIASLNYFRIFNRWGNLVFETKDVNTGWDGVYKGQPQVFGVYIYEVQAVTTNGTIYNKTGNLTLIR